MAKRNHWTLALTLLASASCGGDTSIAKADHLANQVWLSRMPSGPRDIVGHLAFIRPAKGKRFGVIGRSSRFRVNAELFAWSLEGDQLALFFPQEHVKANLQARTWKCAGEAPEPFELCLELSANGRNALFFSREDWAVDPPKRPKSASGTELDARWSMLVPDAELDFTQLDLAAFEPLEDAAAVLEPAS